MSAHIQLDDNDYESLFVLGNDHTLSSASKSGAIENDADIDVSNTPPMGLDNCMFDLPNIDSWQFDMNSPFSDDVNELNQLSVFIDGKDPIMIDDSRLDDPAIDQFLAEFEFAQRKEQLQQIPCLSPSPPPLPCNIQEQTIKSPSAFPASIVPIASTQYQRTVLPKPFSTHNSIPDTNYQQQQNLQPITSCVKLQSYTNTATSGKKCVKIEPLQSSNSQASPNITIITATKPITVTKLPLVTVPTAGSQITFVKSEPDPSNSAVNHVTTKTDKNTYYSAADVMTPPAKRRRSQSSLQQQQTATPSPLTASTIETNYTMTTPPVATIQTSPLTATTVTLDQLKVQYGNASEEALKKHLRMIKNRESASLSRKRRKQLMEDLEVKVKELTDNNERLKTDNSKLLNHVHTLEIENELLRSCRFTNSPIRARKPLILMGIVLLVAVNIFTLKSLSPTSNDMTNTLAIYDRPEQYERSLPMVPSRAILSYNETPQDEPDDMIGTKYPYLQCVAFINKTHSQRINKDLHSWVEDHNKHGNKNGKGSPSVIPNHIPLTIHTQKPTTTDEKLNDNVNDASSKLIVRKRLHSQTNNDIAVDEVQDHQAMTRESNSLQPYHRQDRNYDEFFRAIDGKNDTVYIVSFKRDHLILPATVQNQTQRPKMSLIMPASINNINKSIAIPPNHVPMIRIDCEVDDTKLVYVKRDSIPFLYRNGLFHQYTTAPQNSFS
ncbi:unnamed protein product [Didymodactylos carnosus]|uniref:BZIP domain-containing protein n=1 Tax=Didymodactylos carnosus TaxID=1234261 RepID=A0A814CLA8_9BILA|nr:unnamed protein product [Didymodactylos carnosus]CAF0942373.1 unnamed protein product [Didymodactylos carnosus]CAF3632383.1 unnamed protein product [Didymodactylos carnosus]CAF3718775.1 unnamed protein product [Didymodactylos carnosus]